MGEEKFKVSIYSNDRTLTHKEQFKTLWEAQSFINEHAKGRKYTNWRVYNNGSGLKNMRML